MYTVNSLFGKPVIAQDSGEQIATIKDVVLDQPPSRVLAVLIDTGGWMQSARVVRWEQVVSLGDVLLVRGAPPYAKIGDDPEMSALSKQSHQITGTTIMSVDGSQIGTVGDLFIETDGRIVGYEVKKGFFQDLRGRALLPVVQVRSVGADAVIVDNPELETPTP